MESKEFTKDMYKLYVAQRKRLDDMVPKSVREQYSKKEQDYEEYKQRQKEKYHQQVVDGGEDFRKKIRERNNASYQRRKARELQKRKTAVSEDDEVSTIPDNISRYSESITQSNYSVDDDEEDLESVFSYETEKPVIKPTINPRFIGF